MLPNISEQVSRLLTVNTPRDILRFCKLPILLSFQLAKLVMMIWCGCQFNELNNWMSHAIREPYYWRVASDGTRFVAGPYSPLWYLLNQPARLGYTGWMLYLYAIDLGFSVWVFWKRSWLFIIPYMMGSVYFYNVDPIDLFIFQLALLGMFTPWISVLTIIVKLPWIPPFTPWYVWQFVFNNPYGIHEPGGWVRYAQMGLAWLGGIALYLYRRKKRG